MRSSILQEKREKFASALQRARHHSSSSSIDDLSSSVSCISADSLDAFSDPFSSELSECGSFLSEESFGDLFDPSKWTPSRSALDSLPPTPLELSEWDIQRHQQKCKSGKESPKSLELSCGSDDFLATAEDTMEVLSRIMSGHNEHNLQFDLIDMIDGPECTFLEQISLDVAPYDPLMTLMSENPKKYDSVLEKDPWLCDKSATTTSNLSEVPRFSTISPRHILVDKSLNSHCTAFVSPREKSPFKGKAGITIGKSNYEQVKRGKKSKVITPEERLVRREKNRLRSKAYRERRKLQIKSLQEEVVKAKLETQIAIKNAKMSKRK